MRRILAVSGGVDSMALLHYFAKEDVVVAHFNHGTRPSADADEAFVRHWAEDVYRVPFVSQKANLGENVAEAKARAARYCFLQETARHHRAKAIVTAHHANDARESIAINLLRGTGWRGLNPMNATFADGIIIERPFLEWSKIDILKYAAKNNLVFRQDPTNVEEHYLRNRLRAALAETTPEWQNKLDYLRTKQGQLTTEIDGLVAQLLPKDGVYQRDWFRELDDQTALEILRASLARAGVSATRPQILHFLTAIRTYETGKVFNLPGGKMVKMQKHFYILK